MKLVCGKHLHGICMTLHVNFIQLKADKHGKSCCSTKEVQMSYEK